MAIDVLEPQAVAVRDLNAEMEGKFLTFWLDGQLFAIPIADVVQIVLMQPITPIPEFPFYAKGVIDLRGTMIPVVDVRLRLGLAEQDYSEHTCIIVTSIAGQLGGLIVDAVEDVTHLAQENVSPPPQLSGDSPAVDSFLSGVGRSGESVLLLLDAVKLLRSGMPEGPFTEEASACQPEQ